MVVVVYGSGVCVCGCWFSRADTGDLRSQDMAPMTSSPPQLATTGYSTSLWSLAMHAWLKITLEYIT